MKGKSLRRQRGMTLAEVVIASGLSTVVLITGFGIFVAGMSSWLRGSGRINAEATSSTAMRIVSRELREAMTVNVDSNGQGISYIKPAKDSTGGYATPLVSDGITRRIALSGSNLILTTGSSNRTICTNLITTDPYSTGGASAYKIFTPGATGIVRSLNVMIVAKCSAFEGESVTSRSRETVYLRNIPTLTR